MPSAVTPVQELMRELSGCHWIANEYVAGAGKRTAVIDPATEQPSGEFAHATPDEIDKALAAASHAQREWWAMSALDRANAMHQIADRMLAMTRTTGEVLTREMGKPFRESNWE
ncbi:MAG: aldehyde dehydrogenase family protein, partial [Actinomycetota bacterium]